MTARLFHTIVAAIVLLSGLVHAAPEARNLTVGAAGEKRVALVIGNSAYAQGRLRNPVNDARAMQARLKELGFQVVLKENLKVKEIGGVYREFRNMITPGSTALFFYAGHGVQFKGQNFFPAVDADINFEEDAPLQSLNLGTLLDNMDEAKAGVSLVFLDACRDNPFARKFRSGSRGLAKVESASGILIHYATKPGSIAADGDGRNGTYTEALLAHLGDPGLPVEQVLKRVTNRVIERTQGKQEPWIEGSLRGDFYFRGGRGTDVAALTTRITGARTAAQIEDELWDVIKDSDKASVFEEYLRQYPNGRYVAVAKVKLMELRAGPAPARPAAQANTQVAGGPADVTTPGTVFEDCADCPEMVVIPGGMAIGRTEVTQRQWQAVMGNNPSNFQGCADCPVEQVSWNDAQEYLKKLSQSTGKNYRLPTESEWERACRAGSQQEYCGSDNIDSVAWYNGNSGSKTHAVAGKQANAWGLNDMSGNVWEWTDSCYDSDCSGRVLRGGSWLNDPQYARAALRYGYAAGGRGNYYGFRLARTLP